MALKVTQNVSTAGTPPTFAAPALSDTMEVGSHLFVVYRNTDSNAKTVTVTGQGTLPSGVAFPDRLYNLAAGNVTMQEVYIPLIKEYANPVTNLATVVLAGTGGVTGVTSSVVRSL